MQQLLPWRLESSRCRRNSRKSILMILRYNFSNTVFTDFSLLCLLLYWNCEICWLMSTWEFCASMFVCILCINKHVRGRLYPSVCPHVSSPILPNLSYWNLLSWICIRSEYLLWSASALCNPHFTQA
jgi:uncharacterized membrane protein